MPDMGLKICCFLLLIHLFLLQSSLKGLPKLTALNEVIENHLFGPKMKPLLNVGVTIGLLLSFVPALAFADESWGCLSQDKFWERVGDDITTSDKSAEITLSGRHHASGYQHANEYDMSLHLFEDGSWVIFDMAIRGNEVLYCLVKQGSSSSIYQF